MTWEPDFIDAVRSGEVVFFIGAGFSIESMNSKGDSPPNWKNLLIALSNEILVSEEDKNEFNDFLKDDYLEAAEFIKMKAQQCRKMDSFNKRIETLVDGPRKDKFEGSRWHDVLMAIDPKIIVTTNYDRIIERFSKDGYVSVTYNSKSLASKIRTKEPVAIKIHGSLDVNDSNLVLTRSDYKEARDCGQHVFSVVKSLLLTRRALFLGYSVGDPDIQLILENTRSSEKYETHHVMLTDKMTPFKKELFADLYGIKVIEYGEDHNNGFGLFEKLKPENELN